MSNELAQFENAARQVERLLAELSLGQNQLAAPAIGPDWVARAQSVLSTAEALLASCRPAMLKLKSAPEVCHYRRQLEMMNKMLQQLQPRLQTQSATLRNEYLRVQRLQGWANSVSMLK
jgi:hypothetical protein